MRYGSLRRNLLVTIFLTAATLAFAGDTVVIREWDARTPGSFPHDPAAAPDGALWYTGMTSNTLGRLDPSTGDMREYPLKTPDSGPHGLVADKEGNIWFTANFKAYIGRLDPITGELREHPMPDAAARDPHTPVFDQRGILWFTVQTGNFVGRLDPATGTITLRPCPTRDARPYGIAVSAEGVPFFCEFGTNRLARIAPDTMTITEYTLPKGARPRRRAIASDGVVYYTDYARGRLGRFDPRTQKVQEWQSPSGPHSGPYGMTITPDGKIWYSESGVHPNTIVRFDPASKTLESWPVPSGGGVIRNMAATAAGDIYIACSGVNKIGIVSASPRR